MAITSLVSCFVACDDAVHSLGTVPGNTKVEAPPCGDGSTGSSARCRDASAPYVDARASGSGGTRGDSGPATTDDAASPSDGAAGANSCSPRRALATRRGLNLLLVVDASLSVVLQPAWTSLTTAISAFVSDDANAGLGVGIEYYGTSCQATDYEKPAVPIADLPDNAARIAASYPLPINGKAIAAALRGAATYVRTVLTVDPKRASVVVLITDGVLDPLCGATADAASAEAAAQLAAAPGVSTYVIALGAGPDLVDPTGTVDRAPLDAIARAGGTDAATPVQVSLASNAALTSALSGVTGTARPCAFAVPVGFDGRRTSIAWSAATGAATVAWPQVAGAAACGSKTAVFLSAVPGFLELCPAACTELRRYPDGLATAVEACAP